MTENDAKSFGYTVIYKPMKFIREYVTCNNCKANYDQNDEPRFCQPFTMPMNPDDVEGNMDRAAQCGQWCAKGMDRSMVVTPDYKTWYEEDDNQTCSACNGDGIDRWSDGVLPCKCCDGSGVT